MPNPFSMIDPITMQISTDPVAGLAMPIPQGTPQLPTQTSQGYQASPTMIPEPTMSRRLIESGLAMIAADQQGLDLGSALSAGMKGYNQSLDDYREKASKNRREQLAEFEILGRIRERQLAEQEAARRMTAYDKLKEDNPELASLIDADPSAAASIIAKRLSPDKRQIVKQNGVAYYADTGEPVLDAGKTPPPMPFSGTAMDAQVANILLGGDPTKPEYLAAYNIAKAPKVSIGADGTPVTVTPDMSAYRAPAFNPAPMAPTMPVPMGLETLPEIVPQAPVGGILDAAPMTPINLDDPIAAPSMGSTGGVSFGSPELARVEGYDFAPDARPTGADAKAVKEIAEAEMNITKLMDEREALINKSPSPKLGSAEAIKLDQNTNQLALTIKSLEQTGALDEGSVDVMMKAIGDPIVRGTDVFKPISSTRESLSKIKGGSKLQKDLLKSGRSYVNNKLQSAVKSRGYIRKGTKPAADAPSVKSKYSKILGE